MADNLLMSDSQDASNGCAYFGEGVKFKGSISVPEKIVVHGTVEGDVESRELFVGPNGIIKGNVRVDEADVQGKILENIEAKVCLSLRKTGMIEGKAVYGEIEIEKGGILSGEVSSINRTELDKIDGSHLVPLQLKRATDGSYGSSQLSPLELPQLAGASRQEGRPRPDAVKSAAKQRLDSNKADAKKEKEEAEETRDTAAEG
jgi:cytoskeletal protein CcmA (bactofilin family)